MSYLEIESNSTEISNDGVTPCVKINNMRTSAKFYDADSFNNACSDYIDDMINNNKLVTEEGNHLQACNALNCLYVDIDYHMPDGTDKPLERNEEIVRLFIGHFCDINDINENNVRNTFIFVPQTILEDNEGMKVGGHCFIYMKENYTKSQREKIYDKTKQLMLTKEFIDQMVELGCTDFGANYDHIFDKGPFCSANALIPFAEKKDAKRHYVLINPNDIDPAQPLFNPTIHRIVEETPKIEEELDFDNDLDIEVEVNDLASRTAIETNKFIESLKYLCPVHPLWDILKDHNNRLNKFASPIVDWLAMCQFVGDNWNVTTGITKIPLVVAKLIHPLVRIADPEKSLSSLISDINNVCMLKYSDRAVGSWRDFFNKDYSDAILCFKDKTNDGQILKALAAHCKKEGMDDISGELFKACKKILKNCVKIWARFCKLIHLIMDGMTEEIRPFREHNIINLDEPIRDCSFDEIIMKENNPEFRGYHKVIKRWLRMFICMMFYNKLDTNDAIRSSIGAFVKYFVFNIRNKGKIDSDRPYVYNIRQNAELQAYPHNQWVVDNKAAMATSWFGSLYVEYVDEELQSYKKFKFITPFIEMLKITQPIIGLKKETDIQAPVNFKSDIKRIRNNILQMASNRPLGQMPIYQEICGDSLYFPMRNGILEFIAEENVKRPDILAQGLKIGDVVFHYNNYHIYLDGYTNTPWHDEYNENNEIYLRVKEMFNQIYPDKDIREYVLMMFAQVLHSKGTRDQIHQFHGQGGEGKSVINTAVAAMLGEKTGELTTRGYPDKVIKNPYGLATTVEAEALLQANKSTHNSGGTAELINKRFASVQEPETVTHGTNMNVSTGKKLTGDASLSARKIFQEPVIFTPKLYITIQTNTLLGYSEDTFAVVRRYGVIPHNAKFVSSAMKDKLKKAKFIHIADPTLSDNLRENPYYWEALFRVLLPYAQKFIKEGRTGLSDVPQPKAMEALMDLSRANSSGLLGWFAKTFQEQTDKANSSVALSVQYITDYVFQQDRKLTMSGDASIFDVKDRNQPRSVKIKQIYSLLTSRFGNIAMFKLRSEFIDPETNNLIDSATIEDEEIVIEKKMTIPDELHEMYFEKYAVQNLDMVNDGKRFDPNTIYILGFDFVEQKEE